MLDFDAEFTKALGVWIEENRSHYHDADEMEEEVPAVYERWLNTPADWLEGDTPGHYFERYTSGPEICDLMCDYLREGIPVPDPLADRLVEIGDEDALLAMVLNPKAPCAARMTGIELLRELESKKPMVDYLRWQVERKEEDDLLDNALESLRQMGEEVCRPAKVAFMAGDDEAKEALLDVLADYPGDEDVFAYALRSFKEQPDKRALFAGYLAKLGDDRALEALLDVAEGDDVSYTDFIEIRSAIERLGSDAPVRDWTGDPTYQAFRKLQPKSNRPVIL